MADNPFSVQTVNPMQALLLGQQAYKTGQEQNKEQALTDARAKAVQAYQSGDPKTALATLLGVGDTPGANAIGSIIQNDWTRQHTEKTDARQAQQDAVANQHWNASYGLQKRAADRADDPTPANFVKDPSAPGGYRGIGPADPAYVEGMTAAKLRAAAQQPPEGFTKQPDGSLVPIPGGTTDPAYQGRLAAETARAKGDVPTIIGAGSSVIVPNKAGEGPLFTNRFNGQGLSEDAQDIKARQLINGDMSGLTNIGRGAQAGQTLEAISNRAARILREENGMSAADAAAHLGRQVQAFKASGLGQGAEARTAGVREANLNLILRATEAAIPAALAASEKVSRTGWVPLDQIIQKGQVASSNPELKQFGMANLQVAEHWARAMNPTGVMRESDRDKALEFLNTAGAKGTYKAALDQLHTQILRERDAVKGSPVTPTAPSFRPSDVVNDPSKGNLTGPVVINGYKITEH